MPAFPALAAFIAGIVGYPMPVVCQPFTQGTTMTYQVSGQFGTATLTTRPLSGDEAGVTFSLIVPIGETLTITIGGQAVVLPAAPVDTPSTHEASTPLPGGRVAIPVLIALGNCDGWTSDDPSARGRTLLTAIHEAMHAKYADGDEALTECRALHALPTELASLWPAAVDPGAEPLAPSPPIRSTRWKMLHPTGWRKLLVAYRTGFANWRAANASWSRASGSWTSALELLGAANAMDAGEPPQYHGATC